MSSWLCLSRQVLFDLRESLWCLGCQNMPSCIFPALATKSPEQPVCQAMPPAVAFLLDRA